MRVQGARELVTLSHGRTGTCAQVTRLKVSPVPMHCAQGARSQTILKLTCWVCGTNSSTLERERARAHQIGERI